MLILIPYIHVCNVDLAWLFTGLRARELVPNLTLSHLGNVTPFALRSQPEDRLPEPVGSSMNRQFNMSASRHLPYLFVTVLVGLLIMFQAMATVHHH